MFRSKNLSKFSDINHGFFGKNSVVSKGVYKSSNCGADSKDKKDDVKKNFKIIKKKFVKNLKRFFL